MGFEQNIKLNKIGEDGQLDIKFSEDEIKKVTEPVKSLDKDEITKRQKELEELYKSDPDHPEEYWQK